MLTDNTLIITTLILIAINFFLSFYFLIKWSINYIKFKNIPFYKMLFQTRSGLPTIKYGNLTEERLIEAKKINETKKKFRFTAWFYIIIIIAIVVIAHIW